MKLLRIPFLSQLFICLLTVYFCSNFEQDVRVIVSLLVNKFILCIA
jgi:hypothetical protein